MVLEQVLRPMSRRLADRRGLAEIVGTLMLVVIVVAAATAFSFFVAAYQKQVQAEETLNHNKNLENLRIFNLIPTTSSFPPYHLRDLRIDIASLDVNQIGVEGMTLDGYSILNYSVLDASGSVLGIGCLNGNPYAPSSASCVLTIPAESQVFLDFDLQLQTSNYAFGPIVVALTGHGLLSFDTFTSLGNEFVQSFVPPVAIAGVTFVDSNPILDGTGSYQPSTNSSTSVVLDLWNWTVTSTPAHANDTGSWTGQEVELPHYFNRTVPYTIYLNVTNSESLVGSTQINYTFY